MKAYVLINVWAGKAREVGEKLRQIEGIKQAITLRTLGNDYVHDGLFKLRT